MPRKEFVFSSPSGWESAQREYSIELKSCAELLTGVIRKACWDGSEVRIVTCPAFYGYCQTWYQGLCRDEVIAGAPYV